MSFQVETAKVTQLVGLRTFHQWVDSLKDCLAHYGIQGFLQPGMPKLFPGCPAFEEWDAKRQLAKAIIKCSTVRLTEHMMRIGWNPRAKDPKAHFDAAVRVIVVEAEDLGCITDLIYDICRIDRTQFGSLAQYQGALVQRCRKLADLNYLPEDKFLVQVAINGLRVSNPRWCDAYERQAVNGGLTWEELMQDLYAKACREHIDVRLSTPSQIGE